MLLSRLIGLSKFHKLSDVLGLETPGLNAIVETLDCLHLVAHHILVHTNDELGQFLCFSKWLRHEIDMQAAEPMSQTLEELMEKTDMIDYPQTLKYIRGALTKSSLRHFVQQLPMMGVPRAPTGTSDKWAPTGHDRSFYDTAKKLLEQRNNAQSTGDDAAQVEHPKLNDLTKRLGLQFEKVFGQIALTQRRGILHRSALKLHADCDAEVADAIMCHEVSLFQVMQRGDTNITDFRIQRKGGFVPFTSARDLLHLNTSVCCRPESNMPMLTAAVYIYRVILDSENGVSSTRSTSVAAVDLQQGEIRQIQLLEDGTIILLTSDDSTSTFSPNDPLLMREQKESPTSSTSPSERPPSSPLLWGIPSVNPTPHRDRRRQLRLWTSYPPTRPIQI